MWNPIGTAGNEVRVFYIPVRFLIGQDYDGVYAHISGVSFIHFLAGFLCNMGLFPGKDYTKPIWVKVFSIFRDELKTDIQNISVLFPIFSVLVFHSLSLCFPLSLSRPPPCPILPQ